MPLMSWNDKLSVGIVVFDNDHKKLVGMVNDLFDSMSQGKSKEVLTKVLDGLVTYTKTHFAREEEYFKKHGYPDMAAHMKEHHDLASQVMEVQKKWNAGQNAVLSMEVLSFLKNWLLQHIQGSDRKYAPYLREKGVR